MAADNKRTPEPCQLAHRRSHLKDNVMHGDIGAKVVAWNGDADAMGVQAGREVTEI